MEIGILILILIILAVVGIFLITGLTGAPYVPTHNKVLNLAFSKKLYPLSKTDYLIDLGAGNGKILEKTSEKGAKTLGIELNPILAILAKLKYRKNPLIKIRCRNFYNIKFPDETTVVYAFAIGLHMGLIYHKIEREAARLGHPIYFISNAFSIPDKKPLKKSEPFYLYKIG